MTLEVGTRLGHYRILALLGRGGMADVYRAEDEHLRREVALKAVPPEFARDPERIERFRREVRAVAKLSHRNIVTVYEFGKGEGLHFYTMELMPGGHLKARIQAHREGMPAAEARGIVVAVARALEYAHQRGFAHRDVKPENILFGEDGTPQLTDFGIARAMSEGTRMTKTGMSIGSPHYMSPEQAQGLLVDGRSDLYSLGVVLYEMLTGQLPFDGPDTFAVGLSHIQDPVPELPPRLSDWQPVLDRLLAKSPQDRYRRAEDLVEVLESVSRPQVPVTRVTPVERELDSTKRIGGSVAGLPESTSTTQNYAMLAALVGILLALAAVGMCYVVLQDTRRPSRLTSNGGGDDGEMANARERARPVRRRQERSPIGQERPTRARPRETRKPLAVIGGRARLVVETSPPGVEVLVDGTPVGETPLRRSDIRAGARVITLRHPHYETVRQSRRRFRDGRVVRIRRTLVRGRGALRVRAMPRQAWVEVEGKRMAERTPVTLKDLPAGRVEVKIGAPKHRPLALEVEIPKNGLARLERRLEPLSYGSLTLDLEPSDARVMLPDLGLRYRPGMRLPQGAHRVVVRREGYREAVRTVDVWGDTRVRMALGAGKVLFAEDYQSYAVGSRPGDYRIVYSGQGKRAQRVDSERGNRHLRTAARYRWSLTMRKDFDFNMPPVVSVSWRMRLDNNVNTYDYTDPSGARYGHFGGFGLKNTDEVTASVGIHKYRSDKKIVAWCPDGDGSRPEVRLGVWTEFRMDVDFAAGRYAMYKDGRKYCERATGRANLSSRWNSWGESSGIHFSSGNSDNTVTRFDDIVIRDRQGTGFSARIR